MTNQTTAVGILSELTLKAAVEIAISKGLYSYGLSADKKKDFAVRLSNVLKHTVKSNLDRVLDEWKDATEANVGELWLQKLMTTQATELAQMAIESL